MSQIGTEHEKENRLERFVKRMGQPGPDEEVFFARRRELGLGVGLDADGKLVRQKPKQHR